MFHFYQRIIALRKKEKAQQDETIRMYAKEGVFYLIRVCGENRLATVLNNTDQEKTIALQDDFEPLISTEHMEKNVLKPFSGCICRLL